jgi:adenosylcobinamide-GDP ribazoletransferase
MSAIDVAPATEPAWRRELRALLTAIQYFTRIPVPCWVGHNAAQLARAARYFPLVGSGVGIIGALTLWLATLVLPTLLAVIISTTVTIVLTGAFHEDGLADTFDGLGGSTSRVRALEIMKDSRLGTFGMLALLLAVLLKIAALAVLAAVATRYGMLALVAAHSLSRACAVMMAWCLPYARSDDSARAKPVIESLRPADLLVAIACGLIPLAVLGAPAVLGVLLALLVFLLLFRWFKHRLGGYTGDTLGATQQSCEIAFYLGLVATWTSN